MRIRPSARVTFLFVALLSICSAVAQDPKPAIAVDQAGKDPCDCSIVPWRPPACADKCLGRAIANSNRIEIKTYFRFDEATLSKIDDAKKEPATETAALTKILADAQAKFDVTKAMARADKVSIDYLLAEPRKKLKLIEDKSVRASLPAEVVLSREKKGNS